MQTQVGQALDTSIASTSGMSLHLQYTACCTMHPCWLTRICISPTGVERMAEVLRGQAPQLLRHLLPENSGAFAHIFTAALLQVQPHKFFMPLDTRSPASSSCPSHQFLTSHLVP